MNGQDKHICLKKIDFQKLSKSTNKDKKKFAKFVSCWIIKNADQHLQIEIENGYEACKVHLESTVFFLYKIKGVFISLSHL